MSSTSLTPRAACNTPDIISDWPTRKNFQQKYDQAGKLIWTDDTTNALLTGALIFPPHESPTTKAGLRYGRNEVLTLYIWRKTNVWRSPRQCGSKLQHLLTVDEMRKAMNSKPAYSVDVQEAVLQSILPLVPMLRIRQRRQSPSDRNALPGTASPGNRSRAYSGPRAISFRVVADSISGRLGFHDGTNYPPVAGRFTGPAAAALAGLAEGIPVLQVHVVLPPDIRVETWSGVRAEIIVPSANNIEYATYPFIANTPASESRVKALPAPGSKFVVSVAPGFLSDVLRVWSSEDQRRRLAPDITIIQRFTARKKGGKMNRDDFLAAVYTFEIARAGEQPSAAVTVFKSPEDEAASYIDSPTLSTYTVNSSPYYTTASLYSSPSSQDLEADSPRASLTFPLSAIDQAACYPPAPLPMPSTVPLSIPVPKHPASFLTSAEWVNYTDLPDTNYAPVNFEIHHATPLPPLESQFQPHVPLTTFSHPSYVLPHAPAYYYPPPSFPPMDNSPGMPTTF